MKSKTEKVKQTIEIKLVEERVDLEKIYQEKNKNSY